MGEPVSEEDPPDVVAVEPELLELPDEHAAAVRPSASARPVAAMPLPKRRGALLNT